MSDNLLYGMQNNKLISVDEVERGLKCNCTCPHCGDPLIARQGNDRQHHFAHSSNKNCKYGYETSLHLLAKEIISKSRSIFLPNIEIKHTKKYVEIIKKGQTINIDKAIVEYSLDDIKPDLLISSNNQQYIVEIYVTHKVDEQKYQKIKQLNIPTIEINLSKYRHNINEETLQDILLNENKQKYWIYNEFIDNYFFNESHKQIERENEIKEKINKFGIKVNGFTPSTCPLGNTYVSHTLNQNVIKEFRQCNKCTYCDGIVNNYSICLIKNNSFENHLDLNKACPICNIYLKPKMGVYAYLACPNYNSCRQLSHLQCPLCESQLKLTEENNISKLECLNCDFSQILDNKS